jgi:hypothetical protein
MARQRISNRKRSRKTAKRTAVVSKKNDKRAKVQTAKKRVADKQLFHEFLLGILGTRILRFNIKKFFVKRGDKHGR